MGHVTELSGAALYLARYVLLPFIERLLISAFSDASAFCTGTDILIDGYAASVF